ncbi:MAG TPA: phosphate signaling complex protein PhoU [Candidatus Krumholzibacteria bacterium]|nr:phosphate signaling complex protein PhoU [Candidatus Krumholzibacteria bacterium]
MIHLMKEIEVLKRQLLALSGLVEDNLWRAVRAFEERDADLAEDVIARDSEIDAREVELEEECLKALALHQPVAVDLRFIVSVLKINNDLERIGDLAVNIARRSRFLAEQQEPESVFDLPGMAAKVQGMLQRSLDALVTMNAEKARGVCADDDEIDAIHRRTYQVFRESVKKNPERIDSLTQILSTSNHLERIGDHATNIAEDVIYMVEGQVVRHGGHL